MATTLRLTSDVPPSIELPFERSQPRVAAISAGVKAVAFPAQALAAHGLDHQLGALLGQGGGGVFDDRGGGPDALAGLGFLLDAADGQREGLGVHPVLGDAGAQVGVGQRGRLVLADIVLGDLVESRRRRAAAEAAGGNVLPLVLQQPLGDLPAAVQLADQIAPWGPSRR